MNFLITVACATASITLCPLTQPRSGIWHAPSKEVCQRQAAETIRKFGLNPASFRIKCEPTK